MVFFDEQINEKNMMFFLVSLCSSWRQDVEDGERELFEPVAIEADL